MIGQGEVFKHLRKSGRFSERRSSQVRHRYSTGFEIHRPVVVYPASRRRSRIPPYERCNPPRYQARKSFSRWIQGSAQFRIFVNIPQGRMARSRLAISVGAFIRPKRIGELETRILKSPVRLTYGLSQRTLAGTMSYVSPEMILGQPYGRAVDIWVSSGCGLRSRRYNNSSGVGCTML